MYCKKCGSFVLIDAKYCNECGQRLTDQLESTPQPAYQPQTYQDMIEQPPAAPSRKPKSYAGTAILLLIAAGIGAYYLYYLYQNIYGGSAGSGLGTMLAQALIMPHMAAVSLAVILNIFAWLALSRGLSLASAILYTIAIVSMPIAWANTVIPAVLCYIAFGTLGSK